MESTVYELKPILLAALSIYAISSAGLPAFGRFFGLILLVCSLVISYSRFRNRGMI